MVKISCTTGLRPMAARRSSFGLTFAAVISPRSPALDTYSTAAKSTTMSTSPVLQSMTLSEHADAGWRPHQSELRQASARAEIGQVREVCLGRLGCHGL